MALAQATETFIDGFSWLASPTRQSFEEYKYWQAVHYRTLESLEKRQLVSRQKVGRRLKVSLTEQGLVYAKNLELLTINIPKPKKWDGLWRIVIFDIPEEHKVVRDVLRNKLKQLGFVYLQKSVFVLPWPCEEQVKRIQKIYKAERFIKYLEVKSFDDENRIKKQFGLLYI